MGYRKQRYYWGKTIMSNPLDNTDLNLDPPGRGRIYGDITETIGNTPLVRLNDIAEKASAKAEEIWADTAGNVDTVVMGVGTGGTLTGVAGSLKAKKADVQIVAVEPEDSPVISGGSHSPHMIQGIGAGFIPPVLDTDLIDGIEQISNDDAIDAAKSMATSEGIPCGISSGAAVAAALRVAARDGMKGKTVVAIVPDFAERYMSSILFDGMDILDD